MNPIGKASLRDSLQPNEEETAALTVQPAHFSTFQQTQRDKNSNSQVGRINHNRFKGSLKERQKMSIDINNNLKKAVIQNDQTELIPMTEYEKYLAQQT